MLATVISMFPPSRRICISAISQHEPKVVLREGETIPLSDSDEEAASDTESLDGVSRQADMFLLNEALSQYGIRSDVVRIAAGMMKVKKGTLLCFLGIM